MKRLNQLEKIFGASFDKNGKLTEFIQEEFGYYVSKYDNSNKSNYNVLYVEKFLPLLFSEIYNLVISIY